jgi:hypothetical protein
MSEPNPSLMTRVLVDSAASSATLTRSVARRPVDQGHLRQTNSVARSLSWAALGGALGGYIVVLGVALYALVSTENFYAFFMLFLFPFYMAEGALFGLVTGSLTLLLENLIEQKLASLARAIAASVISILIMVGVVSISEEVSWTIIRIMILPGLALGFPVGLLLRSKRSSVRWLLNGAIAVRPGGSTVTRLSRISAVPSIVGGLALRLVGIIGFLTSVAVLATCWWVLKIDERLVASYAVYYFGCTICVTGWVSSRWLTRLSGAFLNGLLLMLALFWDTGGQLGRPGPLLIAFLVLTFLWLLFIGAQPRPLKRRTLAMSHPGAE